MKRSFFNIAGALAVLLAAGLVASLTLAGCGDKDSGDPTSPGGGGKLTLNNGPSSFSSVMVYEYNGIPATQEQVAQVQISPSIAMSIQNTSPFTLFSSISGSPFTENGTFLVVVVSDSILHFKGMVSFIKGSATVDFKSMTLLSDLPLN
jgi:hypothetical protein